MRQLRDRLGTSHQSAHLYNLVLLHSFDQKTNSLFTNQLRHENDASLAVLEFVELAQLFKQSFQTHFKHVALVQVLGGLAGRLEAARCEHRPDMVQKSRDLKVLFAASFPDCHDTLVLPIVIPKIYQLIRQNVSVRTSSTYQVFIDARLGDQLLR